MKIIIVLIILVIVAFAAYYLVFNGAPASMPGMVPMQNTPTENSQSAPASNTSEARQPQNISVSIQNFSFNPNSASVKTGDKVTWTNNDGVSHTVTSDTANQFNSGTIAPGKSFSFTFQNAGSFSYHCSIHPSMHGQVVVQ